jgi:hypothetical protein
VVGSFPNVVLLLGRRAEKGVWKFLFFHEVYVGIPIVTTFGDRSLADQIKHSLEPILGSKEFVKNVTILEKLDPLLIWPDGGKSVLFLAEFRDDRDVAGEWVVLPEVLRRMPKNHNRVTFMKVFQSLSSSSEDKCEALELTRELLEDLFPDTH